MTYLHSLAETHIYLCSLALPRQMNRWMRVMQAEDPGNRVIVALPNQLLCFFGIQSFERMCFAPLPRVQYKDAAPEDRRPHWKVIHELNTLAPPPMSTFMWAGQMVWESCETERIPKKDP